MAVSRLISIDVGVKTGVAEFDRGLLVRSAAVSRRVFLEMFNVVFMSEVVWEEPRIYKPSKAKGDPNLLKGMIRQSGALELLCTRASKPFKIYEPRDWKGTKSKAQDHAQSARVLSIAELRIWDNAGEDERDAIGIGLQHLGRRKQPFA